MALPTEKSMIAMGPKDSLQLYYGPPGVGKTTFVNGMADRVLFISTDRGSRTLNAFRKEVYSWTKLIKVIDELEAKNAPRYDIVCIDHVDDVASMCEVYVCEELGVDSLGDKKLPYGQGWKKLRTELEELVRRVLVMNIGLVFIAHEDLKTVKQHAVEKEVSMPSIPKSAWKVIVPMMDIIGYCTLRRIKEEGGEKSERHMLRTQPTSSIMAKDRSRRKKPEDGWEELDGKLFVETFDGISNSAQTRPKGRRAK